MTLELWQFWTMFGFAVFGAIIFILVLIFNDRNTPASEIVESMERFFLSFNEWIFEFIFEKIIPAIVLVILIIIITPPLYIFTNVFLSRNVKLRMLVSSDKEKKAMGKYIKSLINTELLIKQLRESDLIEYHNVISGDKLYEKLGRKDYDIMRLIVSNTRYWKRVSRCVPIEIVELFAEKLHWNTVLSTTELPRDLVEKNLQYVNWETLTKEYSITEDFFFDYSNRIDVTKINRQKNNWLKKRNRSDRMDLYLEANGIDI